MNDAQQRLGSEPDEETIELATRIFNAARESRGMTALELARTMSAENSVAKLA